MEVRCEKLMVFAFLWPSVQKCPPTLATHSRGGAETTSTMKSAWDLISPLEEKVKVSRFSLSLGETVMFSKNQKIMS